MATDYISREAAWNGIYNCPTKRDADGYIWVRTADVAHMIDDIPAADVREAVRGKWEWDNHYGLYGCSNCHNSFVDNEWVHEGKWRFCPSCGADMRRKPGSNDEKTGDADSSASVGMTGEERSNDGYGGNHDRV